MPRLEDVLAELAALPGVRAAALAGFDGLLVDEARPPEVVADGIDPEADGGAPRGHAPLPERRAGDAGFDLGGAVVELTHAWNALRRACAEHLGAGAAREVIVAAEGGLALARLVGERWFVLAWADPAVDLAAARDALRLAAERLTELVA